MGSTEKNVGRGMSTGCWAEGTLGRVRLGDTLRALLLEMMCDR
jgi:hypothetical protein